VSAEFLLTSFIVIVSPGTGVLYTLTAGLSRGSRASVIAAFGCTLGIVPHMAAAIMGLAALLHTSAPPSRPSNIWASLTSCTWPGAPCASAAP
jgi:threonine/homoserine/homoserine lactone efflux protein